MKKCFLAFVVVTISSTLMAADWLQFRGNNNDGVADGRPLPTAWSETENIAWKADLPGRGASGPIVVKGRVVVTASSGAKQDRLHVLCFDVDSGKSRWERQFWATGRSFCHPTSAVAAPTPASDGVSIYALFSSNDLVCLDLDGNLRWLRGLSYDHPTAGNDLGMASSPIVVGKTVVVQIESQGESFVAGIDTGTGRTRWRLDRPHVSNWVSPTVLRGKTRKDDLLVLTSGQDVRAVNPRNGEVLWTFQATCKTIPSAAVDENRVMVGVEDGLIALQHTPGSLASPLLWKQIKLAPSSSSPVAHKWRVYVLKGSVLVCGDTATGEVLWQQRVKGRRFWATPVLSGGRLLVVSADGDATVLDITGEKGKIIGEGQFGENVLGSPAAADGAVYVRNFEHLWKVGK